MEQRGRYLKRTESVSAQTPDWWYFFGIDIGDLLASGI